MAVRNPPKDDQQLELFSAMLSDIAMRDARETMDVCFLSISKTPRFEPIVYKNSGIEVVITGGRPYGIANIWDWDLMLWLLSQVREALDKGQKVSRRIRFHRRAFLKDVRRAAGGQQYQRLEESIARLANTNVFTTIRPKPGRRTTKFTWVDSFDLERDSNDRMTYAVVVIPEWLFEAVCDQRRVLTLDRDYFLLTGGLERWFYRTIRKGAGTKASGWRWKMRSLYERAPTEQHYKYFARELRKLVRRRTLLGYELGLEREGDVEFVWARPLVSKEAQEVARSDDEEAQFLRLRSDTYERAKSLAPGHDVYALAEMWEQSTREKQIAVRSPDAAFLGWCKTYGKNHPER